MIQGRTLTFGKKFSTKDFVDMSVYKGKILTLSSDGILCIVSKQLDKVEKWIDLIMQKTTSIQIFNKRAICAGDNAVIKVIDMETLILDAKFPKPPPNCKQNITKDEDFQINDN